MAATAAQGKDLLGPAAVGNGRPRRRKATHGVVAARGDADAAEGRRPAGQGLEGHVRGAAAQVLGGGKERRRLPVGGGGGGLGVQRHPREVEVADVDADALVRAAEVLVGLLAHAGPLDQHEPRRRRAQPQRAREAAAARAELDDDRRARGVEHGAVGHSRRAKQVAHDGRLLHHVPPVPRAAGAGEERRGVRAERALR